MADEDRELFEAALSNEPASEAVQEEPAQEQPEGQPRDEHGRFAQKAEQPEAQPEAVQAQQEEPQSQEDRGGQIPAWRLKEEADARRAAEQRAQEYEQRAREFEQRISAIQAQQQRQQQPAPEVPDIFENPQAYTSHIQQTFEHKLRQQELQFSLRMAQREYKGEFEEAWTALQKRHAAGDQATVQAIEAASDPGEAMVRWHRQQKLYETTGGDLDGYFAKKQEELLNDPAFLAKAVERIKAQNGNGNGNGQRPVTQLPPSLSRVPAAASAVDDSGDMSDEALFKHAMR